MGPESSGTERAPGASSHEIVGPYRLLEKLGEGGMGEVWVAEQSAPVRRRVAVKVIKAGMDTKQVIARFEAERQALALMDHPAIAKVFDAGETARGLPYFAMEFVRGERITAYCDTERLTNDDRLRLFLDVCHAVQHAHQKGIIHRDLKPGNVLVTIQDGKPVPKIIDFGLAKAVAQRLTDRTLYTEQGVLLGTPEYMSPEQAEMSGLDVDTRTDIYALGVILYELLSGVLPFDPRALRAAGFDELRRQIRNVEPPPPSLRVSLAGAESKASAERRRTVPSRLAETLHGELDWIVMKAIEKDRTRRYASPNELAADIGRYLVHEPVTARPPSTAYRARKFVQRHKLGVAVASAGVLGLLAFAGTMAIQARRIAVQRDEAAAQRDRAERVSDFLTSLFKAANPTAAAGETLTVRDLLDRGAARIEHDLAEQPLVRADLMYTIGSAYRILGLCGEAERMLEPAAEARESKLGPSQLRTLETLTELGGALWCAGKLSDAEAVFRRVLEHGQGLRGPDANLLINATHSLGGVVLAQGQSEQAEALYRDALDRSQRSMGAENPLTLGILLDLSNVVGGSDPAEAVPIVRDLLPRLRSAVGEEHPSYIVALANLTHHLLNSDKVDETVSVGEDALVRARRVLGDSAEATINLAAILAQAYFRQSRYEEAKKLALSLIETVERSRGAQDRITFLAKNILGSVHMALHEYAEAERLREATLAVARRTPTITAPALASMAYNLACSTALQGKRAEAVEWLRQSMEHGYRDADWMTKDADLESLRGDPEFQAVVEAARERAAAESLRK